ncbi:hypothetical protein JP74_00495 [Devosia sp. 17-2-E-8]|nr:hypothetical protein JP74_00495 [Devosia sp. 17-2-E-8]
MSKIYRESLTQAFRRGLMTGTSDKASSTASSGTNRSNRPWWIWPGGGLLALMAVSFALRPSDSDLAEEKQAGFHCLSAWNGSHQALVDEIKGELREPNSFEHISTEVTKIKPDGTHGLIMKYRARNGLGGMAVENIAATYRNSDCNLVGWQTY